MNTRGMNFFMKFVFGLLSRKIIRRARKRGVEYSFLLVHPDGGQLAERRLLRETKMSIVDVALEVGYATPSHFAQLFRRETGLSPSDYRRQR